MCQILINSWRFNYSIKSSNVHKNIYIIKQSKITCPIQRLFLEMIMIIICGKIRLMLE